MNEGKKYDADKPQLALIPALAIIELGKVMTMGAQKYEADNWRKGITYRRIVSAALRHLLAISDGEDVDPESGLNHAAHVMANMAFLIEFYKKHPELDDRYKTEKD